MPPIYIGEELVTAVYKQETQINSLSIGETIVEVSAVSLAEISLGYSHIDVVRSNPYPYSNRIAYSHITVLKTNNYS